MTPPPAVFQANFPRARLAPQLSYGSGEPAIEESDLIRKILQGEKDLFADLVTRHETRVYRVLLGILGDPHQAEEAAQEVFVKAYRALGAFRGDAAFSTWITRIAINRGRDLLRRRKIRRIFSLDSILEDSPTLPEALIQQAPEGPPEGLARAQAILARLPEGEREVLLLQEVEGLSYEEIAGVLKTSVDGVKGRLKRVRIRVRHLLGEENVQSTEGKKP